MAVDISIIVPCRGRATLLQECLASLMNQKTEFQYEIIVVYCQKDFEVDAVVKENEKLHAVKSEDYLFAGAARNFGATHAVSDILGFIDSDCIVNEHWVTHAVNTIRSGAVLCSGAIRDGHPYHLISSADNRLQYADFPDGRPYGVASYFPGAHIAIKKEIFQHVGGFSVNLHGQDVIFTMQVAKNYPEKVIFNPQMVIRHHGRMKLKQFLKHQEDFGFERTYSNIQMNRNMMWLARHSCFGWIIFFRRFLYITMRVVQWNFLDLPKYILQSPFLFLGLIYWVKGFYKGWKKIR